MPPPSRRQLLDRYRDCLLVRRRLSQRTWHAYRNSLVSSWDHQAARSGHSPGQATPEDVYAWLDRPRPVQGCSHGRPGAVNTRHGEASRIRTFYGWAAREGIWRQDLMARLIVPPRGEAIPGRSRWRRCGRC